MTHRILVVLLLGLALAACSTRVEHRIAVPERIKAGVTVEDITVSTASGVEATDGDQLVRALREVLAAQGPGPQVVDLKLHVKALEIVDPEARLAIGLFAGSNQMVVAVQVLDDSGAVVADFDVDSEANPGGYGAFYDQKQETIREAALVIVLALRGEAE